MACTTPPEKRPNSAETAPVVVVVSCSASSMKRSSGMPRRFSFTTTPLMVKRLSKLTAPAMVMAPRAVEPAPRAGPVLLTPGASDSVCSRPRLSGSFSTRSVL